MPGNVMVHGIDSTDIPRTLLVGTDGRVLLSVSGSGLATEATVSTLATQATQAVIQTILSALSKAEDAPHASGDAGVMALGVRKDTATARGPLARTWPLRGR